MSTINFKSEHHEKMCHRILDKMHNTDAYHTSLAYLLALDDNISYHDWRLEACFDFKNDSIKPNVLEAAWITGTDRRVLQLGFNLWNDTNSADVSDVFGSGSDLEYLLEAVRIRFGGKDLFHVFYSTLGI